MSPAPPISVALPTFDTEAKHLRAAIDSVLAQTESRWELCIADDGSRRAGVREMLSAYASADPRIEVELLDENSGISAASNRALAACDGEFVAFLDHDDVLAPDALAEVARAIAADPSLDVIYSDQDKLDRRGERVAPFRKPDWSPVYALGAMYVGHLLVVRRTLVLEAGGFDPAFDTIQDFELLLRVSERTERVHHLPRVLYHWRAVPGSIAAGVDEKSGVPALQAAAVNAHLRRRGIAATAVPHPEIPHRARLVPEPRSEHPLVSAIVVPG
ncbi:MAG: glycosyltransferase family 2 protein, partial [Solirubrobacterales bacterium]